MICGCGNHGELGSRGDRVLDILVQSGIQHECLTVTEACQPGHPLYILYIRDDIQPAPLADVVMDEAR